MKIISCVVFSLGYKIEKKVISSSIFFMTFTLFTQEKPSLVDTSHTIFLTSPLESAAKKVFQIIFQAGQHVTSRPRENH